MFSIPLNVSFGKSEVQNENFIGSLIQTNTEVIRFNISVDKVSVVHILNSCNHLVNEHQNCLEREFS